MQVNDLDVFMTKLCRTCDKVWCGNWRKARKGRAIGPD
jgi:hypothetical protein